MNQPKTNKNWAKEAIESLNTAVEMAITKDPYLSRESLENIYQYGPDFCLKNRGITDSHQAMEVTQRAIEDRIKDFEVEPDERLNYSANFLLAYLESHVYLKIFPEKKVDEIMHYIIDNYEIDL